MSSEEDDVLSVSDDMCTSDAEPEDIDFNTAINVYSSDSSVRNSYKPYDNNIGDSYGGPQRPILPELPKELELRPTTTASTATTGTSGGPNHPQTFITVCARTDLKLGTIFGPYQGKIRKDPITTSFNWKVTDRTATFTAWLELLNFNAIQWITCIRKADRTHDCNAILLLFRGQLYIELTREVNKGSELQLISTEVLLIHEDPNGKRDKAEGSLLNDLLNSQSNFGTSLDVLSHNIELLQSSSSSTSARDRDRERDRERQENSIEPVCQSSSSDANIKCSLCDQQFDDQLRLNEHLLFSHCNEDSGGADREYKCNQCPKVFNWKSNLIRHQVAHDESRRYTCENCKKVFTDPSNLQRHIRSQHIGARSHACPDCGKTFATSSGLKQHTHIHSSVKPFRCEVCFKAYTQFSNLCRHKRMHANCRLQIKCNKCGQAFSTVTSLSKHKRFCEGSSSVSQSAQSHQQISPAQRNVGHINLNLSPNLSSPDSTGRKADNIASLADITSPLTGQTSNPFLSAFHSRPGFPFYSPFFGTTFPTLFPNPAIAGSAISPGSSTVPALNISANSQNSENSFLSLSSIHNQSNREEYKSESIEKLTEKTLDSDLKTQNNIKREENTKQVSHSDESVATDLSDRSDLDEDTEDEEVAITGDSDSELDEKPVSKSKVKDVSEDEEELEEKEEKKTIKTDIESETAIMSGNRESSPKQGAICPVQMISSNGYIRPLSLMVDHLHSDLPFDLSRNKPQRRLLEDSPEFKSKVRDEHSTDEPLDLTVKHRPIKESPRNGSPHSASAVMANNYEEMMARHRAMLLAEANLRSAVAEEKTRQSQSPTGHIFNHNNHHKIDTHFQQSARPVSPASKMMAYPRPIHPLLLESMYRMQMEGQHKSAANSPAFPMFGNEHHNRMNTSAAAFPAFPAARYPPMLSPAQLLGSPAAAQATFDFMRAHMNDKIKAQTPTELMSPQMIKAKERYTCKFCGKVFPRSANLTRHLRTHTGEQPYKCKYCERSFSISSNLQRHVRNIHNKEKPFKCPLCDRCFGQQTNLDRHLKKHESDGPTILDGSAKLDKSNHSDDQYFNEIRNFMGKVTDRALIERQQAFRALIESPALSNGNKQKLMSSPKTNGNNNDDNETVADEESDMESESLTTTTTGADGTPSKKTRTLQSDTSSVLEDEDVVMSEDGEDEAVDSATDEETSVLLPSENGNNRSSSSPPVPPVAQSPPVGHRTRGNISSVVACLSKKAQQKLNGINGCAASVEEEKNSGDTALPLTTTGH